MKILLCNPFKHAASKGLNQATNLLSQEIIYKTWKVSGTSSGALAMNLPFENTGHVSCVLVFVKGRDFFIDMNIYI